MKQRYALPSQAHSLAKPMQGGSSAAVAGSVPVVQPALPAGSAGAQQSGMWLQPCSSQVHARLLTHCGSADAQSQFASDLRP